MNPIFVSTTFLGTNKTDISEVLEILIQASIDRIELGSTHKFSPDYKEIVKKYNFKRIFVHNYCPPSEKDLILNIASVNEDIRKQSIEHIKHCLIFAKEIGAELYTVHPGFVSEPSKRISKKSGSYDFSFNHINAGYEDALKYSLESLDVLIEFSGKTGMELAVETEGSFHHHQHLLFQRPEEFDLLLKNFRNTISINFNFAHTMLAAKVFKFNINSFIDLLNQNIKAVEVSHCDLIDDQHLPLICNSYVFDIIPLIPSSVPLILEFRNTNLEAVQTSIGLIKDYLEC